MRTLLARIWRERHLQGTVKPLIIYVTAFILLFTAVIVGTAYAVVRDSHQQAQWCQTLELLTKTKVPYPSDPKANPSRLFAYDLYTDFVHLKHEFGCSQETPS